MDNTRSKTDEEIYAFVSGADMNASKIRTTYPEARFVARARLHASTADIASPLAMVLDAEDDEIWGILLSGVSGMTGTERRTAVTDEGQAVQVDAQLPLLGGQPLAVLAAARYWELSPAYVARLTIAVDKSR